MLSAKHITPSLVPIIFFEKSTMAESPLNLEIDARVTEPNAQEVESLDSFSGVSNCSINLGSISK
jgi:hypothetical protein